MNPQHPESGHAPAARHRRRGHRRKPRAARRVLGVIAGSVALGTTGGWFLTAGAPGADDARPAALTLPDRPVPDAALPAPSGQPAQPPAATTTASPAAVPGDGRGTAAPDGAATATAAARATPATTAPTATTPPRSPAAAPHAVPAAGSDTPAGATAAGRFVGRVAELVNEERAKQGCAPLTVNPALQSAAQAHSDDMAARHYFDHADPEGHHADSRITAAGYRWSRWGENIAQGQQDPAAVMTAWMNSPGHRANILDCDFREIGVGVTLGAGGPWWTQVFATAG
ncbi:CAP domain-containing protein [Kitasatospora sp. NBC_00315]|uniref:CAP domain-containing protein n=1 Tax=Kitasatospora sp. NBC_00315 TaxID=2975963 RepID=UPI00324872CE